MIWTEKQKRYVLKQKKRAENIEAHVSEIGNIGIVMYNKIGDYVATVVNKEGKVVRNNVIFKGRKRKGLMNAKELVNYLERVIDAELKI